MSLIPLLALALMPQKAIGQSQPAPSISVPSGGQVISLMFARYSHLQSLRGTITLTDTAKASTGVASTHTVTAVQFETPGKLYINQQREGTPKPWLVTSDGIHFSYNLPPKMIVSNSRRLVESVNGMGIAQIYEASVKSIGDRSVPLGVLTEWSDELRRFITFWPTHDVVGEELYRGHQAWHVTGDLKEYGPGAVVGRYDLLIGKEGDLYQYKTVQQFAVSNQGAGSINDPVVLTRVWDVDLERNAKVDPVLFKVVL